MTKVSMSMNVGAEAKAVWDMIGGFNALPDWHPAIVRSEIEEDAEGSVRTLHLAGGGKVVERLDKHDEEERSYSYSIVSSPLPVANYSATIRLKDSPDGDGCVVEWESDFEAQGAPEGDAVKAIQDVYTAGLDNLRKMFGG